MRTLQLLAVLAYEAAKASWYALQHAREDRQNGLIHQIEQWRQEGEHYESYGHE